MRYGFVVFDGTIHQLIELGYEAEAAGWDGVFVADAVYGMNPWVTLTGIAMRTERILLGPMLTPVSRRRPWQLASEVATLDQLSGGRALLPVGLGAIDTGFDKVGEQVDRKARGQLLDEGLEIIEGLWSGEPFTHAGTHYQVEWNNPMGAYRPVQTPRVPIWVVGAWPRHKSMQRAVQWDGLLVAKMKDGGPFGTVLPSDLQEISAFAAAHRSATTPLEIIMEGVTPGDPARAAAQLHPLAEAGLTWWIESMWGDPGGLEALRTRIRQGPPATHP